MHWLAGARGRLQELHNQRRAVLPRDGTSAAAADTGKSMSKAISNDEDVTKVMIAITAGMSASGSQMAKNLGYWGKYEHIWEYNKDAQLKRFTGNRPGSHKKLESFDEEIKRYKDHPVRGVQGVSRHDR